MIDFVKIAIKDQALAQSLAVNENLTFQQDRNKMVAKLRNMQVMVHDSGRVEVSGSLHHYWNNGGNWNDFGRLDLFDTVLEVCQTLQIDPEQAKIQNLEYGVNICPPIDPAKLLKRMISYKDEIFVRENYKKGYFVEATKDDYFVKCYDKGKHQDREEWILRFERKSMTVKDLRRANVQTLADLLHADNLRALGEMLIETFDGVLITQPLDMANLTATERKTYDIVTNVHEWEGLKNQHKRRAYLLKSYERLVTKHTNGLPTLKQQVRELIATKWAQLLERENWAVLHNLHREKEVSQPHQEIGRFSSTCNDDNLGGFPTLCIVVKPTNNQDEVLALKQPQKVVKNGCGVSKILKCGNCRKELCEPIHVGTFGGVFCNTTCEQLKKERNDKSNPRNALRHRLRKSLTPNQLFDPAKTIKLNDAQRMLIGDVF